MSRVVMGGLLGRRLVTGSGLIGLDGIDGEIVIRRDRFGIPHVEAGCEEDAWFGVGFCHGQDRAFQLEMLTRVVRGEVAAMVGPDGLPVDRLSRRFGFHRSAERQLAVLDDDVHSIVDAYARGVNAGRTRGARRRAHEFALLRTRPTRFEPSDVAAIAALQGLLLGPWDAKLVRLKIALSDGVEALAALDGSCADWLPVTDPPGVAPGAMTRTVAALQADLDALSALVGEGGGSNNWVIAGSRTMSGRAILANDPHLAPLQPPHWYLAHARTPHWEVAGATLVGLPGFPAGHNDVAAWGVTASAVDNTDLGIEQVGADGRSVRRGEEYVPCEVRREVISVRGREPVVEEVLVTPDGPIIGPALDGEVGAVSIRATWLQPRNMRATAVFHLVRGFDDLRNACRYWPAAGLNVVYADTSGTVGWQITGDVPRRTKGYGTVPFDASDLDAAWDGDVDFDDYPHALNPEVGWIATANNKPTPDDTGPFLGVDWLDGYRVGAIADALARRDDWDLASTLALQMDVTSLPWRELRDTVLGLTSTEPATADALAMLRVWDGRIDARSAAASIYELFMWEMAVRVARAKAPKSADWVLGRGFNPLVAHNWFWRTGRLVRLLREQPSAWFERSWPSEMADALAAAMRRLQARGDRSQWAWGAVRPLTFRHVLGGRRPLDRIFNLGPMPWSGDFDTIGQTGGGIDGGTIAATASMRMVIDVGNWSASRFSLPGGQSGNPLSAHYDDLLSHWVNGTGVPIAWTPQEVTAATTRTLRLTPSHPA